MAKMKYLDGALALVYSVIDHNWAVHELADVGPLPDRSPHAREARKQFDMVEQGSSET